MAAKLSTVGAVTLKNLRQEGGAEAVDMAASVALKKSIGDTAVTLRLTEATFANMKSLNGALLTLSKPLGGGVSATAKYDLASKGVVASLSQVRKFDGGRLLEAGAVWSSRTRQWLLEATGKPHAAHKLSLSCGHLLCTASQARLLVVARCNPHSGAVSGAYSADVRGFTVTPSYSLAKRSGAVAVARKLSGGQTLRATYSPTDRLAMVELANKPFKVGLKTRATRDGCGPFTLGISVERDIALGSGGSAAGRGAKPAEGKGGKVVRGPAARDTSLDEKLAALDAALDARFAAKGANARRLGNGVDVVSFQNGPKEA